MSAPAESSEDRRFARLPPWLRPRAVELPGSGTMRLIETTLLVLVAVLLIVATVNDLSRQVGVNRRLNADLATWRAYTGRSYHNIGADQELLGASSQHEVVCGNTSPGPPKGRTQICLTIWGPVSDGRRTVHGGWYLPPGSEDQRATRYGCFGEGGEGECPQ